MNARNAVAFSLAGLVFMFGAISGCTWESRRKHADFVAKSTKSAAANVPAPMSAGMAVVAASAELVSRDIGKPKTPMASVDFSRDTTNQQAVVDAGAEIKKYKKEIEAKEKLIATLKNWGIGGLVALLGLFGIKAGWIMKLVGSAKQLKGMVEARSKQVTSLIEGTHGVIDKAKIAEEKLAEVIEKAKSGKVTVEDLKGLAGVGQDTIKKVMKEFQVAHGTWDALKGDVAEVKKFWSASDAA